MNRDNSGNSIDLILVGKCPLSLSDYRKEEIIRSMNLIKAGLHIVGRIVSMCLRPCPKEHITVL